MARTHHITLNSLGYMLDLSGYLEGMVNPLATQTRQGDPSYSDLRELSAWAQTDWRGGRAENRVTAGNRFSDGAIGTWIAEHLVSRPLTRIAGKKQAGDGWSGTYFKFGNTYPDNTWPYTTWLSYDHPEYKIAFSLNLADPTTTISSVTLFLSLEDGQVGPGTGTLTFRIEDGIGEPSGNLVDANATASLAISNLSPLGAWFKINFGGSFTFTDQNWVVISASGHSADAEPRIGLGVPISWPYDHISRFYNGSTWAAGSGHTGRRPLFFLEDHEKFGSTPTVGCNFNGNYYIGVGTQLYKWDNTNREWDAVGTARAAAITDLDAKDGTLYVALGKSTDMDTMNTSESFTTLTGYQAQIVYFYQGYMYRADGANLYYWNGSAWSAAIAVGDSTTDITGMAGLNGTVLVAKPEGLWEFSGGPAAAQVKRWETEYDANNGTGMCEWNGAVYIPVKFGLSRFDGKEFRNVGPDQDEGLPADRMGKIVSMAPLLNYLLVAVDASGASQYGSVFLFNGEGWHELGRAWRAGERVRMVGYDFTNQFVHYSMGGHMATLTFSDVSDNIIAYDPGYVEWSSYVETSWISGGLLNIWKLLSSVWINFETSGTKQDVHVDYRVDRQSRWRYLGKVLTENGYELDFKTADSIGSPGTVSSINATTGAVTLTAIGGIAIGHFVRLGHETRYVIAVSSNTFTPHAPYDDAEVGDQAYGGFPTCREVQLRIRYSNYGDYSPRIRVAQLSYVNQLTGRRQWVLPIRIEDNITTLGQATETRTGEDIYDEIIRMQKGNTLYTFTDLRERSHVVQLVKVDAMGILPDSGGHARFEYDGTNTRVDQRAVLTVQEID